MTNQLVRDIALDLDGHIYLASPLILLHQSIDIILGVLWMKQYEVVLDTSARTISLTTPDSTRYVTLQLANHQIATGFVHSLVVDPLEEIPVVNEYLDVFPEELPGIPPVRAVEF